MRAPFQRRKLLVAAAALTIVVFAAWFEPTCVVKGWLRGEAFYQGRPTSYWSRELSRWQNLAFFGYISGRPGWLGVGDRNTLFAAAAPLQWNPFTEGAAVPLTAAQGAVWIDDLADARTVAYAWNDLIGYRRTPGFVDRVAGWFGVMLEYPDRPALLEGDAEALPVLRELLHDPDEVVRGHAERALNPRSGPADLGPVGRVLLNINGRARP